MTKTSLRRFLALAALSVPLVAAQDDSTKMLASQGPSAIPKLAERLSATDRVERLSAVKAIISIGSVTSLDPLVKATQDADAEIQMRATDGLVNYYLPGYYREGISGTFKKLGTSIKGRFADVNTQIIPHGVEVREDVIRAAGHLIRAGATAESKGNAARAVGVLRGSQAVPDLEAGLASSDAIVLEESLVAARKVNAPSLNPGIARLLKDPDEKVQLAALEALAALGARDTSPSVEELVRKAPSEKVRRSALTTLGTFSDPANRQLFTHYLQDKDPALRGAAAEGIGRLGNPDDLAHIERLFSHESKNGAKLSFAFASVKLGRIDLQEGTPLAFLVRNLRSRFWADTARPFLLELARDAKVREALYPVLRTGTKDEKLGLCWVLTSSGDAVSLPHLEALRNDPEAEVSTEAIRAIQVIRAR